MPLRGTRKAMRASSAASGCSRPGLALEEIAARPFATAAVAGREAVTRWNWAGDQRDGSRRRLRIVTDTWTCTLSGGHVAGDPVRHAGELLRRQALEAVRGLHRQDAEARAGRLADREGTGDRRRRASRPGRRARRCRRRSPPRRASSRPRRRRGLRGVLARGPAARRTGALSCITGSRREGRHRRSVLAHIGCANSHISLRLASARRRVRRTPRRAGRRRPAADPAASRRPASRCAACGGRPPPTAAPHPGRVRSARRCRRRPARGSRRTSRRTARGTSPARRPAPRPAPPAVPPPPAERAPRSSASRAGAGSSSRSTVSAMPNVAATRTASRSGTTIVSGRTRIAAALIGR